MVREPQRQDPLRAGASGDPLIRGRAAQRHPRFDLHEPPADIVPALTAVPEAETVVHRGYPVAEIVGPEGQQITRVFEVVIGQILLAEEAIDSRLERLRMGKVIVQEPVRSELVHQQLE